MRALCLLLVAACGKSGAPVSPEDAARTFAVACARCHGPDGKGGPPVAAGVAPRNFADPIFQSARTDDHIRYTITNGKGTAMPAFGAALSKPEIDALVAHIRTLAPRR